MSFARWLGRWPFIIGVWAFCGAWLWLGLSVDTLTLALSILALTFTQLVLQEQCKDTARWDRKMDELIYAVPDARDEVAGD